MSGRPVYTEAFQYQLSKVTSISGEADDGAVHGSHGGTGGFVPVGQQAGRSPRRRYSSGKRPDCQQKFFDRSGEEPFFPPQRTTQLPEPEAIADTAQKRSGNQPADPPYLSENFANPWRNELLLLKVGPLFTTSDMGCG